MIAGGLGLAAAGSAAATLYAALEPTNSLFGPVTGRGPRDRRVYLTFDDGPNPLATRRVLDTLGRYGVPAAFFMAGPRRAYRVLGWTFGVWDTARPGAEEIRYRIRRGLRPGAVLLLHDGDGYDPLGDRTQTADALPGIIADVAAAGYAFATLPHLFAA